jgi:PAS domain S-box-containing protein
MALLAATSVVSVTGAELERRTAAEKALRVSEGRLRTILDTEPEWVQVADREGRITEINPAGVAMLGVGDAKDVVGTSLDDRVADEHRAAFQKLRVACLAGSATTLRFAIDVSGGGTRRWLDAHAVPLRDADGQISAILSVLRDITAQKHAEDERERLQRQLVDASRQAGMAEVATGVLHNVGNVLNSVNVSAGVIAERLHRSKVAALRKAAGMLRDNRAELAGFLTADPKGKLLPDYFFQLSELMTAEQQEMTQELTTLSGSVEHI